MKKRQVRYLSPEELLIIHFIIMDGFFVDYEDNVSKEQHGIKDINAFQSAINLPKQTYDGKELYPTILDKAATMMRSLIKNHPFLNGNKRTAVLATIMFLEINYFEVKVPDSKLFRLAMAIVHSNPTIEVSRIVKTLNKYAKYVYVNTVDRHKLIKAFKDLVQSAFK